MNWLQIMVKVIKSIMEAFLVKAAAKKGKGKEVQQELFVEEVLGPVVEIEDVSTDLSEVTEEEVADVKPSKDEELKKETHYLPKGEYLAGPTNKEWVFLHHTAGWNNPYRTIDHWARDSRGAVATEFVLGGQRVTNNDAEFDGVLVKAFPEGGYGWHLGLGRRKVHTHSVGIELNSFGYLTKSGYHKTVDGKRTWIRKQPGKFYTYVGTEAHPDQVIELEQEFRGYKYWHNYSDAQLNTLRKWIKFIALRDNIDVTKGLPELIKEVGAFKAFDFCDVAYVEANPGLWCHTNVQRGKVDLYPHPELIKILLSL